LAKPDLGVAKRSQKKRFFKSFFSAKVMKGDGPERKQFQCDPINPIFAK
jgi:hypothetical protein